MLLSILCVKGQLLTFASLPREDWSSMSGFKPS